MTRHFPKRVCRAVIGVVFFAQLAVSAYACPGLARAVDMQVGATAVADANSNDDTSATADSQPMDCASMAGPMDPEFANLCAEHCRHGQQSDQAGTLTVPTVLLTALYFTPLAPEPVVAPRPAADTTSALAVASPPLAILHCCFRI